MNRLGPVCDKDCLNCKFDDCIYDEWRAYQEKNREKIAAYQRAYREKKKQIGAQIT